MAQLLTMTNNPVADFILKNFKLNEYERYEFACKRHIRNKWGELILPDGTTINPKVLQLVRIMLDDKDDCCGDPIDANIFCALYVVLHEGELYYLDVDREIFLHGKMWDYGDNTDHYETWNTYIVPDMSTCNRHLYPMERSRYAVFTWSSKQRKHMTVKEASEKGYLENMM